jgi:hypothetical protein
MQCTSVYMCVMLLTTAPIIFAHIIGRLIHALDTVFSARKKEKFCVLDIVDDRDSCQRCAYSLMLSARTFVVNALSQ